MTRLVFATFLAPNMRPVYQFIADRVGQRLGVETILREGVSFDEFASGAADAGFL
jgi:hypothetical protein